MCHSFYFVTVLVSLIIVNIRATTGAIDVAIVIIAYKSPSHVHSALRSIATAAARLHLVPPVYVSVDDNPRAER